VDVSVQALEYWHWLSFGILLLIAEVAVGGASFLMWVGFAALFTGVVSFILPGITPWQVQLLMFGASSVVSVLLWRRYVKDVPVEGGVTLNKRGAEHVGKTVVLQEAIVAGHGRINIDDTLWSVRGVDAPAGSLVRIVALEGNVYVVEPVA
jgi:membrane protein implicated in regulation of membrane protease activity